jgi:hypothetical protein
VSRSASDGTPQTKSSLIDRALARRAKAYEDFAIRIRRIAEPHVDHLFSRLPIRFSLTVRTHAPKRCSCDISQHHAGCRVYPKIWRYCSRLHKRAVCSSNSNRDRQRAACARVGDLCVYQGVR